MSSSKLSFQEFIAQFEVLYKFYSFPRSTWHRKLPVYLTGLAKSIYDGPGVSLGEKEKF